MRTIGLVTIGRSDYGIYCPLLRKIQSDPELELRLIVGGMHLSTEFGLTVKDIEEDGFKIAVRIEMSVPSDESISIAESISRGVTGFARYYARVRPDILVVLGDRFEMYSATLAALPFKIPVAHIHGGELTEGAIDDSLRHSMTKLSHLHFVATHEYRRRVIQMGEEPWRVTVCGAPGLENLETVSLRSRSELEKKYGFSLKQAPLLVTFHPTTLEYERTGWQVNELLAALDASELPVIFTLANADMGGRLINHIIKEFVLKRRDVWLIDNLGTEDYFSLMAVAVAMVGNSSSGIIEAPSFKLPVVNIGNRQKGRVRGENVIDVDCGRVDIEEGIRKACSFDFRNTLEGMCNPYDHGKASDKITEVLKRVRLDNRIIKKRFYDIYFQSNNGDE